MAMVSDQMDMSASTTTTPFATQFIECHIPIRLKLVSIPCIRDLSSLLQTEVDRQIEDDRDRLAIEGAGLELPTLDRVDGVLVEPHRQRLERARVGDVAVRVDDGLDDDQSFDAGFARDLGVLRLDARSEEHTSELQSPYVISYAVFCLK